MNDSICHICIIETKLTKIECGHEFCSKCMEEWFNINPKCPLCIKEIPFEYKSKLFAKNIAKNHNKIKTKLSYLKIIKMLIGISFVIFQIYSLKNSKFLTVNNCLIIIDLIWILYDIYLDDSREKILKNDATEDIDFLKPKEIEISIFQKYMIFIYIFLNIFWFPLTLYFIQRNFILICIRISYYFLIVYWSLSELIPVILDILKPQNLNKVIL